MSQSLGARHVQIVRLLVNAGAFDSADPGQFDQDDANFLAGFAGLLGVAIERQPGASISVPLGGY